MRMSSKELVNEGMFQRSKRRTMEKQKKKVRYGDKVFPSGRALASYLKLGSPCRIYTFIKEGNYKGVALEYVKD